MALSFQYISDLHLEMFPGFRIENVKAPYLILAGDIGDPSSDEYTHFIQDCASKFEKVFVVIGNHEAYGKSLDETINIVRQHETDKVIVLERTRYDLIPGKLRVIGATLWSHIPEESRYEVQCFIQDYMRIKKWDISDSERAHDRDVIWIAAELSLAEVDGVDVIVVTHHAPLLYGTSSPQHEGGPLNCAFASNLKHMLKKPMLAWVHGHTHYSNTQIINDVIVTSNQRGYKGEYTRFDPDKVLNVL